jgi:dCTP deaminase
MRLSDIDIQKHMDSGDITFEPQPTAECFGSFSIDVRLANVFRQFRRSQTPYIDLSDPNSAYAVNADSMEEIIITDGDSFFLHPGEFALGMTCENIKLATNIVGWLDGRSSLARLGLMVHITAHSIDPGWEGNITFEFFNAGRLPLALKPGLRIGAISFEKLSTHTSRPYGEKSDAKYHGQKDPLASRITS